MTQVPVEWGWADHERTRSTAAYFAKALQQQLQETRQALPAVMQSDRATLLSPYSTEIIAKEPLLQKPQVPNQVDLRRLDGLDALLTALEMWFKIFFEVLLLDWIEVSFEMYAHFWHCLPVVFKLSTLDEPGWDIEDARRRIDLLDIVERFSQTIESLPTAFGMVNDVAGDQLVGVFGGPAVIQAAKAKFAAGLFRPALLSDDPWMMELFGSL